MGWTIEAAGKSDVGCVRANNEDNFGYDGACGIYAVSDGMGGQAAGEVASRVAITAVLKYFRDAKRQGQFPRARSSSEALSERGRVVSDAISRANSAVLRTSSDNLVYHGMGATLDIVLANADGRFTIGHVGDSRVYLIRGGTIHQLTYDHSFVMEQVRRGLISKEEASKSDIQNVVLRALGAEEELKPDIEDRKAEPGDLLLLCSDGLTRELSDSSVCELINRAPSLRAACDSLVHEARIAGGGDNITVLLLRFERQSWLAGAWSSLIGKNRESVEPFDDQARNQAK